MKIELLHPVNHSGVMYTRGVHDLPEELAKMFLTLKDGATGAPIVRLPQPAPEPVRGTVERKEARTGR